MCAQSKTLQADTTSLGKLLRTEKKKLADTEQEFYELKKTYDFLKKSTGEELAKLGETLSKKGVELEEKQKKVDHLENLLAERQAMLDNLFASIKKALVDLAKVLEKQENITVLVEGHTDTDAYGGSGQIKDNWDKFLSNIELYISEPRKQLLLEFYTKHEERFIMMPASHKSQYHNCFPGGYVDHVIRVVECALKVDQV